MTRPIHAHIDLSALEHNLWVARRAAPHARILAVLKADAYGHGLRRVATALFGADGIGVLNLADALLLRELGYRGSVVLLEGLFSPDEVEPALAARLTPVVHEIRQLDWLLQHSAAQALDVWLKFNSGMNRLGFPLQDMGALVARFRAWPHRGQLGLMTHFACADEAGGTRHAREAFLQASAGQRLPLSLANSAALFNDPLSHRDWVRPGIMLYGASPMSDRTAADLGLRPAMTLRSEIIGVQTVQTGDRVGYGGKFQVDCPRRVGIVACGYADGYPRHAPNGTPLLVQGRRAPLAGRVSMDMLAVDISHLPDAQVGAAVELWGRDLPVDEVAQAAGTIGYELLCALMPRVPVSAG